MSRNRNYFRSLVPGLMLAGGLSLIPNVQAITVVGGKGPARTNPDAPNVWCASLAARTIPTKKHDETKSEHKETYNWSGVPAGNHAQFVTSISFVTQGKRVVRMDVTDNPAALNYHINVCVNKACICGGHEAEGPDVVNPPPA